MSLMGMESVSLTPETLAACDAVLIVTDHTCVDYGLVVQHAPLVVDTRNATKGLPDPSGRVVKA
jgi:UDP-N-acetyl-D-glucosamine dehydrogenase